MAKGGSMTKRIKCRSRCAHVDLERFYLERRTAGLTQREAAAYLGVSLRTLRNWERGTFSIPYPAFKLVRMRAGGIVHAPGWEDWRFDRQGALWSPDGRSFKSWELHQLRLVFSMARRFLEFMTADTETRIGAAQRSAVKQVPFVRGLRLLEAAS
jgi:transcriptional regulator with XRE-family HTH domain